MTPAEARTKLATHPYATRHTVAEYTPLIHAAAAGQPDGFGRPGGYRFAGSLVEFVQALQAAARGDDDIEYLRRLQHAVTWPTTPATPVQRPS